MQKKLVSSFCDIKKPGPAGIVIFGASGHLANKKIIPGLFSLYKRKLLSEDFFITGCSRTPMTDENFRDRVKTHIEEKYNVKTPDAINNFLKKLYYVSGSYDDKKFYKDIYKKILPVLNKTNGNLIIYLSTPPMLFKTIICNLEGSQLVTPLNENSFIRIVIEKPFGKDMADALQVDKHLKNLFSEDRVYRIDHYLGKETVQNILMFRFANTIFEPVWNRHYIDNIQVRVLESVGIENRAGYFENTGTLLDMFQNHVLRILTLAAMEPPPSSDPEHLRDERVKVFESLRMPDEKCLERDIVRAQYKEGEIASEKVSGYMQERGVAQNSQSETFFAARLFIDNWRWYGVPFYVETGKRLAKKMTRITVTFKKVPYCVFSGFKAADINHNVFTFDIEPDEGLSLKFQAKSPRLASCLETQEMDFIYKEKTKSDLPDAYERLLLDCMLGDQTLFVRSESIHIAWKLVSPILKCWRETPELNPLRYYEAGSLGPKQAVELLESDGRKWY